MRRWDFARRRRVRPLAAIRGRRRTSTLLVALGLALAAGEASARAPELLLADPDSALEEAWEHRAFGEATDYSRVVVEGRPAIRAIGRESASGLYREVDYALAEHPWLEWSWRVERLQESADLRRKATQDFAAAVFLIFEDPMLLMRHTSVLSYVWTNRRHQPDSVIASPYRPDTSRSLVIEAGTDDLGRWATVRRNVARDYRRAFGEAPPESVKLIALFTDNDQTGEPVEAYYGAVRALAE